MVIGYAAFNTELKISGTSKVTSNWDIRITNVTDGTPTGSAKNTVKPSWTTLTASMEADLYKKGDAMEYDVTIENRGTLDAKLNDILTNTQNSNSEAVIITFSGYTKGEVLEHGKSKLVHVKIEYNPNYEGEPTSSEVEIEFEYTQENKDPEAPSTYLLTYDYKTNGGERTDSEGEYLTSGSKVDLNIKAYKNGWTFVGWNTDKDAEVGLSEYQMPVGTSTLYAIYKKEIKVTYNKGSNIESIGKNSDICTIYNRETECEITLPTITPNKGYIIDGWYSGSSKVGNPDDKYTVSSNTTLTSKVKVDNISLSISTTSTTNSITVVSNAQADSGITKYEYRINGGNWIDGNTSTTHNFTNLNQGKSYTVEVRVTSKSGKTTTETKEVKTTSLVAPTFSESANNEGKTVTITYPSGCGSTLTCTYQKDSETVVEVNSTKANVSFTMNGSVIATVTDGTNSVNNSYNVTGITKLQAGDIKGGSISLSKEVAIDDEVISITDTPDSTFKYQGSTIICQNGTKYKIGASTKTFSIADKNCASAIVYPSWKCNDYNLFYLNSTPASIPWEFTKYDGLKGTFLDYTTSADSGGNKYYANIQHTQGASRNQISTSRTINVDNYKSYQIMAWCTNGGVMFIGPTKTKNDWLQNLSTSVEVSMAGTNATNGKSITSDITKLSGDYYFAIQEILTNGKDNSCNINYARLLCQTYSYENPGNISFRETIKSDGKTVTVVYPSGCGSTRTCTYQKDNGEVVEVTSNTVDVNFEKNGNIVAKVTDDNGTMSSSYTVSGITSISVGTVRGGSIKLSKNKSINGENITFTTSPSSGFSYAGATVVCGNSTHTISSGTTVKIGTMGGCNSSAIIYPSWRKSDYTVFKLDVTDSSTAWLSRYDTNAWAPTWNVYASQAEIDKHPVWATSHKYYLTMAHTDTRPVRSQLTSQNLFDLTDYSTLYVRYIPMHHASPWGTGTNILAVIPQSAGQNAWVHAQSNQISSSTIADGESRNFNLNISSLKGNYYLGFQMLSTDGKPYGVDALEMILRGTTYSYTNRG